MWPSARENGIRIALTTPSGLFNNYSTSVRWIWVGYNYLLTCLQLSEQSINRLMGFCHRFLGHWVNIASNASLIAKYLNVSEESSCKLQNHSFVSNKYFFQSIISNNKNKVWKTFRLTSFQKPQLQSFFWFSSTLSIRAFFCLFCAIYIFF